MLVQLCYGRAEAEATDFVHELEAGDTLNLLEVEFYRED